MAVNIETYDRFDGAIFGSAIGDAFGYPVQLMTYDQICDRFEKLGILDLAVSAKTGLALFTDDTQLMLFTLEGLLWADKMGAATGKVSYIDYIFYAYQAWLFTQTKTVASARYSWIFESQDAFNSKLLKSKGFYKKRSAAQSNTEALLAAKNMDYGKIDKSINSNQDFSALARVLPVGLYFVESTEQAFRMGAEIAAITHSRPSAYLAAGFYAGLISEIIKGADIIEAVKFNLKILKTYNGFEKCYTLIEHVLELIDDTEMRPQEAISILGKGNNADEALAISLYSAILHQNCFEFAVELAANINGPSDTCAAVCGGILGAYCGINAIPKKWIPKLQYRKLIGDLSERLYEGTFDLEE